MADTSISTVLKMFETLPDPVQKRVVEHMRDYIEDLRDEMQWDALFRSTPEGLVKAAKRARRQIAEGQAKPMDFDAL